MSAAEGQAWGRTGADRVQHGGKPAATCHRCRERFALGGGWVKAGDVPDIRIASKSQVWSTGSHAGNYPRFSGTQRLPRPVGKGDGQRTGAIPAT